MLDAVRVQVRAIHHALQDVMAVQPRLDACHVVQPVAVRVLEHVKVLQNRQDVHLVTALALELVGVLRLLLDVLIAILLALDLVVATVRQLVLENVKVLVLAYVQDNVAPHAVVHVMKNA